MTKYLKPGEKFTFCRADKGDIIYGRPLMPSSLPFFTGLLILQAFLTAAFPALFGLAQKCAFWVASFKIK